MFLRPVLRVLYITKLSIQFHVAANIFSVCLPFHLSCGFHLFYTQMFSDLFFYLKSSCMQLLGPLGSGSFRLTHSSVFSHLRLHGCKTLSDLTHLPRMPFPRHLPGWLPGVRPRREQPLWGSVMEGAVRELCICPWTWTIQTAISSPVKWEQK